MKILLSHNQESNESYTLRSNITLKEVPVLIDDDKNKLTGNRNKFKSH